MFLLTMAVALGADRTEAKMSKRYSRNGVADIIASVAAEHGLPANLMLQFAKIESGLRPWVQTGSYMGLFQLGKDEFRKHGDGSVWDPRENANAFANLLKANIRQWRKEMGRDPTESELYLMHQQGKAGAKAHLGNPDEVAWKNIRRYYGSDRIAKKAIWGNVPTQYKKTFGSVNNITSRQFTQMWADKVGGDDRTVSASMTITPPEPNPGSWRQSEQYLEHRDPPGLTNGASADAKAVASYQEEGETSAAGVSPKKQEEPDTAWLDQAFGKPFGDLYKNVLAEGRKIDQPESNLPLPVPLFKQLFG